MIEWLTNKGFIKNINIYNYYQYDDILVQLGIYFVKIINCKTDKNKIYYRLINIKRLYQNEEIKNYIEKQIRLNKLKNIIS